MSKRWNGNGWVLTMTNETLNIAVVGHTNTGKTSLLRTLLRDEAFGVYKPSYVVLSQQNTGKYLIYKEPILLALFYWFFNW